MRRIGVGGEERSRWIGERPTLPDYRPAIGRAPRLANVYCGYGHQHLGLTLATVTGRLIARQMEGEELPDALKALLPVPSASMPVRTEGLIIDGVGVTIAAQAAAPAAAPARRSSRSRCVSRDRRPAGSHHPG